MTAYLSLVTAQAETSAWVLPINIHVSPTNSTYAYYKQGGGDVVGNVQYTIDPPLQVSAAMQNWYNHSNAAAAVTNTSSIAFAHAGVRLSVTAVSGSAMIAFTVLNPGM